MSGETKKLARDIRVKVFNRPTKVRNGSGAYVSSVQIVENAKKPKAKKKAKGSAK